MPTGSDPCQGYMEQVVLKLKNLSIVQPIQILRQENIMLIDTLEQDLENAINKAYQEIDFENLVAIISQIITDRVHHSCYYLLSDYLLKNRCFYYQSKLYLPNIKLLRL